MSDMAGAPSRGDAPSRMMWTASRVVLLALALAALAWMAWAAAWAWNFWQFQRALHSFAAVPRAAAILAGFREDKGRWPDEAEWSALQMLPGGERLEDGWGRPVEYYLFGDVHEGHYIVLSRGGDDKLDVASPRVYLTMPTTVGEDADSDQVIGDGAIIKSHAK